MTAQQILQILFSFLPFAVCLFWFICFIIHFKKNDAPKHILTVYLLTCVVLYLCHALFFTIGIPYEMECIWTLCSLSVYPLFYSYLCRLTSSDFNVKNMLPWLAPSAAVALLKYAFPDAGMDKVRLFVFTAQIVCVCFFGIRKLKAFDLKLQEIYADTEGRDTTAVHHLLIAIIAVSILSGAANSIGKQFFVESLWLLIPISLAFSIMLFSLSHICFYRDFTIDQLSIDEDESEFAVEPAMKEYDEQIGLNIEMLIREQKFFQKRDVKIGDLAREIRSNRTYVSNYINETYHCSFSDYMNQLRIEYAKELLIASAKGTKITRIYEKSGFSSEQSFYRNFRKFVGMTPSDWVKSRLE